jgi:predicted nucleic acid-binding protein
MRRAVLWDSSAVLALIDADDADHGRAERVARKLAEERRPCLITNYIEAEAHALLLSKLGRTVARDWLLTGGLPVLRAQPAEEEGAREIIARHDDKDYSFCDALSFAFMLARGIRSVFTFERRFVQFGKFEVLGLT